MNQIAALPPARGGIFWPMFGRLVGSGRFRFPTNVTTMPHNDAIESAHLCHDGLMPGFFEGVAAFNRGAYFLAHERWEEWWIASGRPERGISKALIQLAAAMYHLHRGNPRGCAKLLDSARRILAHAEPTALSLAAIGLAQAVAQCYHAAVQGSLPLPAPLFPLGEAPEPQPSVAPRGNAAANQSAGREGPKAFDRTGAESSELD